MGKRFLLWLVVGGIASALAMGGCQKKEEPAPAATSAPAAPAAGAGAVTSAPAGETNPAAPAAAGETKTAEKKEEGTKK